MSSRVNGLKAVKEIDGRIDALDKKVDQHTAVMLRAAVEHRAAVEAWEARATAAFDEGKPFDEPKPAVPESQRLADDYLKRLRHEREVLLRERLRAVADGGPEVLAAVSKAVSKAVEQARPLLAELDGLLAIIRDGQSDVALVGDAVNALSTRGVMKAPDKTPIDLTMLARAVADGSDPLEADTTHTKRVLGLKREITLPDGSKGMATVPPSSDSAEQTRLLDAAHTAQRLSLQGRRLGYRPGML